MLVNLELDRIRIYEFVNEYFRMDVNVCLIFSFFKRVKSFWSCKIYIREEERSGSSDGFGGIEDTGFRFLRIRFNNKIKKIVERRNYLNLNWELF